MADVQEERFALLLAIVPNVDPGRELLAYDVTGRGFTLSLDRRFVDRLSSRATGV
jgi:hypothetical protein